MSDSVSVLIVDDSALMRNLVSKFFDDTPNIDVVATARNGIVAFQRIERFQPDIIILDIEMPEMNGIEFLKERRKRGILIPVIVLSSLAQRGAKVTMEALALGASDFIPKPSGPISQDIHKTKDQLIQFVRIYTGRQKLSVSIDNRAVFHPHPTQKLEKESIKTVTPRPIAHNKSQTPPDIKRGRAPIKKHEPNSIAIIAIGISTGGPNALREVFPHLNNNLPPILVVQHMPKGFTGEFANSLNEICPLTVKEAKHGDIIETGRVLIAPGDQHMEVERRRLANIIKLTDKSPVNGHRPSVDVLFSSIADIYVNTSMAIIMTGMGKDGAFHIGTIYEKGGLTVAQDEMTSVVFGMPKVAIENGVIHHVLPLSKIAETINSFCKEFSN